tara:strand:- start:822 stop:989 length:168 start_codon:yes stop_codon:yes gene_type:complete
MTIQVKYELHQVCFLEFEDQEELDEWDDNGACLDDATIIREKANVDWDVIEETNK